MINAPLRYVFNWCTDFREDDGDLTGSTSQRKILEKTKKRVVYASLYTGIDGNQKIGVNIVTLKAPTSWHLEYFGEEDNEIGEYKLSSLGKNKTKRKHGLQRNLENREGTLDRGAGRVHWKSLGSVCGCT